MRKMEAIYDFPFSYEVSEEWVGWGVGGGYVEEYWELVLRYSKIPYICACTQMMCSERFCCQFLFVLNRTKERGPAVIETQSDGCPIGVDGAVSTRSVTRRSNYRSGINCQLQMEWNYKCY